MERDSTWVRQINDNLNAIPPGGDATGTTSITLPTFFRVPIPLREVSEESYIPKFCPLGLHSHGTVIANSSIHIKFREDFAKIFIDNTGKDWTTICSEIVDSSKQDWKQWYEDYKLKQQGEGGSPDVNRCEDVDKEIKVLLALDTVFVVCFIQGDHQRVCVQRSRCPAVSRLDQEMKKEALFPLVHLIRLDLFKFENQIPLCLIKTAVEMINFEKKNPSDKPVEKFLRDAVDLVYLLPSPRQRPEFKSVLRTINFSNCRHLLECLYLVLCYESESARNRNLARSERNAPRSAQNRPRAERNAARTTQNGASAEPNTTSAPQNGGTELNTATAEVVQPSCTGTSCIPWIWNLWKRWLTVRNRGNTNLTVPSGQATVQGPAAGSDYRGGAVGQVPPPPDHAPTSASHEGNASSRFNVGRSSDQGSAPIGEATAQGHRDSDHPSQTVIDVRTGNSGSNEDHSSAGRAHPEIQLVAQNLRDTGTNAPSPVGSDHGGGAVSQGQLPAARDQAPPNASHEGNVSSRRNGGDGNRREEIPLISPITANRIGGDGRAAAPAHGHASQPLACGFSRCFPKGKYKHHHHVLHIPSITELRNAGIKVDVGRGKYSTNWISEVNFRRHKFRSYNGTLYLPEFSVYDETEILLRNLLVYELVVEKKKDLLSYIHLMDNLINTDEDVKLMRQCGVLKNNSLGSDKLLADMWNRMLIGIIVELNGPYVEVFDQISEHYKNGWNKGCAEFSRLYLRRPWLSFCAALLLVTAIASIAAVVFTVLTYYYGNKQRETT